MAMKCSDLNKRAFILDRELLAKDDYLNFLAQPKKVRALPAMSISNLISH